MIRFGREVHLAVTVVDSHCFILLFILFVGVFPCCDYTLPYTPIQISPLLNRFEGNKFRCTLLRFSSLFSLSISKVLKYLQKLNPTEQKSCFLKFLSIHLNKNEGGLLQQQTTLLIFTFPPAKVVNRKNRKPIEHIQSVP